MLAAGRGPALENAVVSSFERAALERVARLAPSWPRWLNAPWLDAGRRWRPPGISAAARSRSTGGRSTSATIETARAAGLERRAYTVRRRSTFDRLARLGVIAICAEAAALDG